VIDKVGSLLGRTQGASVEAGLRHFRRAIQLMPDSALARLGDSLLERAIGVIYRPQTERLSHYFHADLARQFDAVVHIDRSSALQPLERSALWQLEEPAETYPSGL